MESAAVFRHRPPEGERHVALPVGQQWLGCYARLGESGRQFRADLRLVTNNSSRFDWTYRGTGLPAHRPLSLLRPGGSAQVHACLPLGGTVLVHYRGAEHLLEPGRFSLFATDEPMTATHSAQCRMLSLAMSVPNVAARLGEPLVLSGASELLVRHVQATIKLAPTLNPAALAAAAAAAGELFAATVADTAEAADWQPPQTALATQVAVYIDSRLGDPDLSVERIAAAHHVSVRTLYRIFARRGDTVHGHLRARRIERCHHDLLTRSDLTVSAICGRWGIADVSHFARQYRARFGCTPRETRSRAETAEPR